MEQNPIKDLQIFRETRDDVMEMSVREAIDSIINEGDTPSFYNVAQRSQIARSSLYRKQNLRKLIEEARCGHSIGGCASSKYAQLLEENRKLKREVAMLRHQLQKASRSCISQHPELVTDTPSCLFYSVIELSEVA